MNFNLAFINLKCRFEFQLALSYLHDADNQGLGTHSHGNPNYSFSGLLLAQQDARLD